MSNRPFAVTLATLLTVALVVPATFFIAPQRVEAQAKCTLAAAGGLLGSVGTVFSLFGEVPAGNLTDKASGTANAAATIGECIDQLVIKPMIRSMVRMVLQAITSTIVNWINNTPGTGQSSFVRNLTNHLQSVGDAVALPFINQVRAMLNPQYAAAIASSLLMNYARQTSVGGFLAANQSTLGRYSPDPAAFLRGNWSQGGTSAWFALATREENNPYLVKIAANDRLATLVGQATTNRRQDLVQSKGFLSWCGTSSGGAGAAGYAPGASCYDSTGKLGSVQTPGSVIQGYTQQLLGAEIAQYVEPKDVDAALQIILQTALTAGIRGITTGLFTSSETSSVRPTSITNAQYNSATSNLNSASSASSLTQSKRAQIAEYTDAWNTIAAAANDAGTTITALKNNTVCTDEQRSAATTALDTKITPVITEAQAALASVAQTSAFAQQVEQDAASNPTLANTEAQTLQAMSPSAADVTAAKERAAMTGTATANPEGSLTVSGGSTIDQMNLLNQNGQAISASCSAPPPITS